ncbi:Enkurin domain containing protein [Asbolus verrucosus]|uniref:Enkurin domain containing protein n=1 Tax=Asbolus verrucosus TaxID=1661398 RepID=A0A482V9I1_ASBVE|nr:Enkurin domain containing protein [Asbolus verrucosus]
MNTTTLRGIFPDPKPVHRKNFVRENIKHLKEMQGLIQKDKITSQSQEIKVNRFKHVTPKVYSNVSTLRKLSKDSVTKRPLTHNQISKDIRGPVRSFYQKNRQEEQKGINRGVQTERPEDIPKLYETGVLKYPSPSVLSHGNKSNKTREQGDTKSPNKSHERGDTPQNLTKNLQKLDLDEKQNHIKQNIKNIKTKKREESPDPNLAPATYQKGVLPKYLKERKEDIHPVEFIETENLSGLVLLPDDERKEYLRVARENYAGLIRELNSMPVSNDTLKKRKRKIEIEDELKRLDEHTDYARKPEFWGSEEHISPSPPDSWALNQVPVYRNITTEPELNTLSHIKLEMAEKGGEIMTGSQAELISEPSESLLEDVRAIIDEIVDNLPLAEHEFSETDVSSEMSTFTSVVQGQKHYTDFKMKPQLSRIAIGSSTMFKLPRLDVADSGNLKRQSVASDPVEKLPPIRCIFSVMRN